MVAVITILISIITYSFSKHLLSTSMQSTVRISGKLIVNETNLLFDFTSVKGAQLKSNKQVNTYHYYKL